jgi:glycogen operon protein
MATRDRQVRNFLATLLLSQGVPMLLAGDEIGNTQQGNNNAYCHDNELTWLNWKLDERQTALLRYTQGVIALRKINPVFQRQKFFQGRSIRGQETHDIAWFAEDGNQLDDEAWNSTSMRCVGLYLDGNMIGEIDSHGDPVNGQSILLLLNSHHALVPFKLPSISEGANWKSLLDTNALPENADALAPGTLYQLEGRSLAVLRLVPTEKTEEIRTQPDHVASEVTESVPLMQSDTPPTSAAGGSTLNMP